MSAPDPSPAAEVESLQRSLGRTRVVLALLVIVDVAAIAVLRRPAPAVAKPQLKRIDVLADVAQAQTRDLSDQEAVYFSNGAGDVYLHVMGPKQTCPLHLHRTGDETVLILSGAATFTQTERADGGVSRQAFAVPPGTLISSPPFCGHGVVNPDATQVLANLVFTMPGYDGNFYVAPDDPLLLRGGSPSHLDLRTERARFLAGAAATEERPLAALGGHLALTQLRSALTLAPASSERVLEVLDGRGTIAAGETAELQPGVLVVLPADRSATVTATEPLSLLVFSPGSRGAPSP